MAPAWAMAPSPPSTFMPVLPVASSWRATVVPRAGRTYAVPQRHYGAPRMATGGVDRAGWREPLRRFGPPAAVLAAQLVFFPVPAGVFLRGLIVGLLSALAALGLALIYRANRIINFAQTDLGSVPTSLGVYLIAFWGWNYWVCARGRAARRPGRRRHRRAGHRSVASSTPPG